MARVSRSTLYDWKKGQHLPLDATGPLLEVVRVCLAAVGERGGTLGVSPGSEDGWRRLLAEAKQARDADIARGRRTSGGEPGSAWSGGPAGERDPGKVGGHQAIGGGPAPGWGVFVGRADELAVLEAAAAAARRGEPRVVLVEGEAGAGKSSLVTALLRYWPLEGGTLSLGGTDVERLLQADAREACALADQRAQMFAGTVRSNLTLGRPDATEREITDALRTARLEAWIAALPHGLDTPVGEDGVALSGGERRRLAVARALLAPGPVIVLDEPTSGLDAALADELMDGVFAAAGERSILVITHRAAEAARCESVVTLEAGRVVSSRP